jgi:hypothetical protein
MIDIGKKLLFCKIFENVQIFAHLQSKFAKSAILKKTIHEKSIWVSKSRIFRGL